MTALVLKIVLVVIALLFVVVIVRSLFLRSSSSAKRIVRIRLHKAVGIVAAALIALGLFASVLGFGSGDMRDPVPFRIASVVLVVAGLLVLVAYRNWYLEPGRDEIAFRTVFGAERVIRHRDIVAQRSTVRRGRRILAVTASDGTKLRVDVTAHGLSQFAAAAERAAAAHRAPETPALS
jgi:hypothetical protein